MAASPYFYAVAFAASMCIASYAYASAQETAEPQQVQCAADRRFTMFADGRRALVIWNNHRATLARKASSLGYRYESDAAVLIIDGAFVAFVPRGDPGWEGCHVTGAVPVTYP